MFQRNLLPLQPILLDLRRNRFVDTIAPRGKSITIVRGITLGECRSFVSSPHMVGCYVPPPRGWRLAHTSYPAT